MSTANFPESSFLEVVRRQVAYCLITSQKRLAREIPTGKPSLEKTEAIRKELLHFSITNPQHTSFGTHLLSKIRPSMGALDVIPSHLFKGFSSIHIPFCLSSVTPLFLSTESFPSVYIIQQHLLGKRNPLLTSRSPPATVSFLSSIPQHYLLATSTPSSFIHSSIHSI